jgi:hypothetical protein
MDRFAKMVHLTIKIKKKCQIPLLSRTDEPFVPTANQANNKQTDDNFIYRSKFSLAMKKLRFPKLPSFALGEREIYKMK